MGYLKELIGIASRHGRSRKSWQTHLEHSKEFILSTAHRCSPRRVAVVLGSGWLLDIPLRPLAAMFDEVRLVDAAHPSIARSMARKISNVRLITADLTGTVKPLVQLAKRIRKTGRVEPLPKPLSVELCKKDDVDFVVSANVFSQLPILPLEFLRKLHRKNGARFYSENELHAFGRSILKEHWLELKNCGKQVCLVTDLESQTFQRDGKMIHQEDLTLGMKNLHPQQEWIWDLADFGEMERDQRVQRRVAGFWNL